MAAVLVRVDLGQKPLVKDSDVKSFLQLACHKEQALPATLHFVGRVPSSRAARAQLLPAFDVTE